MKTTISYAGSPAPAADAVQDIKDYLGAERWDRISPEMAKITNCYQFACIAGLAGIQGFPVKAWYELYHGGGSWNESDFPVE